MADEGGGELVDGKGGKVVQITPEKSNLPQLPESEDIALSAEGELSIKGQALRFQAIARRLWAGAVVCVVGLLIVAYMPDNPQKMLLFGLLCAILGGMICTAVMNGRLADNRMELARVRGDLDRKSAECTRLHREHVKELKSSQPQSRQGRPRKKGKKG